MLRFATIGTSFITDTFIRSLGCVPDTELVAVYSRSRVKGQDFAEKHGASLVFDSLEKLAQSDAIDCVYIASPNALHVEQAALMLNHNKHVLLEKPFALNRTDAQMLFDLADEHDVVCMEGMRPLHDHILVNEVASASSSIENLHYARLEFSKISSKLKDFNDQGIVPSSLNPTLGGSGLRDMGVYPLEVALFLFGCDCQTGDMSAELKELCSDGVTGRVDFAGALKLCYSDKLVDIVWGKDRNAVLPSIVVGAHEILELDSVPQPRKLIKRSYTSLNESSTQVFEQNETLDFDGSLVGEIGDFAAYIKGSDDVVIPEAQARAITLKSCEILDLYCNEMKIYAEAVE